MQLITDEQVRRALSVRESSAVVRQAFIATAHGKAVTLPRSRTYLDHVTLSVMGGIVPTSKMCGVKIYSTIAGKFDFVVTLFDGTDGRYLGTVQGNALTEFRTAATTRVAVESQMPPSSHTLTIFGAGVQAKAHLASLLDLAVFRRVFVISKGDAAALVAELSAAHPDVQFLTCDTDKAVSEADVIVTCTRASEPLFDGRLLKANVFVAAIGSSKPQTREIDDVTLERASRIIVEHREQARKEAGDLLLAKPGIVDWDQVRELGDVVAEADSIGGGVQGITVYKSVGIGLVDVALSALVYQRVNTASAS
ncbi:ornithine cyclodeaminase family protein [Pandoraea eparura]|nr:ornithine cyclodeaminase family protein [Pandoraea eparura]